MMNDDEAFRLDNENPALYGTTNRNLTTCERCRSAQAGGDGSFQQLFNVGRELLAVPEIDRMLPAAIDRFLDIAGMEEGMLVLFGEDGEPQFQTARNRMGEDLSHLEEAVRRELLLQARERAGPFCSVQERQPKYGAAIRAGNDGEHSSFICLPLTYNSATYGIIYLATAKANGRKLVAKCPLLSSFAEFISIAAYHALERFRLQSRVNDLEKELRCKYHFETIIGHHPEMVKILKLISQIARTEATVLIQGESGTGKELIARAIHCNSHRRNKPFVPVNCGGIPEHLLESELFGHVRGAFTGAFQDKVGWFERADGGTILLDEVSEMSADLQVRLLRVLQTGEYARVGSTKIRYCNVRVLAASSRDLRDLVREGTFREEVYYRLNVIDINIPPLRERKEDIPLLARHFLKIYEAKYGKENLHLTRAAERLLLSYDYPGNIRELENLMQRAVVLAEGNEIDEKHLPVHVAGRTEKTQLGPQISPFKAAKEKAVAQFERAYITDCLRATRGAVRRAAALAGMDVKNFHSKMKKYGINPAVFKITQSDNQG